MKYLRTIGSLGEDASIVEMTTTITTWRMLARNHRADGE
jgi:hypothetical protein